MSIGKRTRSLAKQVLTEQQNRRYERRLQERKISYDTWIRERESRQDRECGESVASGDLPRLVYVVASGGMLSDRALKVCGRYFAEHSECQLAYGDEDVLCSDGERTDPWFKPDWSPDLFDCCPYFGSVVVLRRELWESVCASGSWNPEQKCNARKLWEEAGTAGYRVDLTEEIWKRYMWWLSFSVTKAGGYLNRQIGQSRERIGHISEILFHCDKREEQDKFLQPVRPDRELWELLIRDFRDGYIGCGPNETPVVSIVIPSKDHPDILEKCLQACKRAGTKGLVCEAIIVDNGSTEENRRRIEALVEREAETDFLIRYLHRPMEFHFSRICNLGAAQAEGLFLLFLNDDVELCQADGIMRMAALADRPFTGAVGMKLYYPDSDRIQHAGITNLPMGPVHKLQFLEDNRCYYYGANRGLRNVLAVTAACLMVEKEKFDRAGGFTEQLPVAFNDVDLCFTLYEQGYYNVCIEDGYAYHHESLSRGDDESAEKLKRLLKERDVLYGRHPALKDADPYYPEGLGREGLDTRIRPAYETAGNRLQSVAGKLLNQDLTNCRKDDCLLLRVEQSREGVVLGYGVVLGDNNACYDFALLFVRHEKELSDPDTYPESCEKAMAVPLAGQYRPDLVENMPDQVNVGLCGFWVRVSEENVEPGRYLIGMAARNRVTGMRLVNWGNRWVDVG